MTVIIHAKGRKGPRGMQRKTKMRGKRCPYCHKFFSPNPKVRERQKTCGRPSCQKALKGERNAQWREENPDCCRGDYPRVKVWLDCHPGYLRCYRQSPPAYVA